MYLAIVVWDLSHSQQTVESLREYLRDYAAQAFRSVEGMHLKAWFSNSAKDVWGAVYFWDTMEDMDNAFEVSRSVSLIGYPANSASVFEVEAVAEGDCSIYETLVGIGRAFETTLP